MKVISINGSPRKNWNTDTLLNSALQGAASQGAETERIHLVDLNYKGCISCFACKLKGGKSYGKCSLKDDLSLVFKKIEEADAIFLGSPIYVGSVTSLTRAFLERFIMSNGAYDKEHTSFYKKRIPVGIIYTMNATESQIKALEFEKNLRVSVEMYLKAVGETETLFVTDTYQFDDYSKYNATFFDAEEKAKRHEEVFPQDCNKAFELGVRLTRKALD